MVVRVVVAVVNDRWSAVGEGSTPRTALNNALAKFDVLHGSAVTRRKLLGKEDLTITITVRRLRHLEKPAIRKASRAVAEVLK